MRTRRSPRNIVIKLSEFHRQRIENTTALTEAMREHLAAGNAVIECFAGMTVLWSTAGNPTPLSRCIFVNPIGHDFLPFNEVGMNEKWKTYLFEYYHDGSWWTLHIPAASEEDAMVRLKKLPLAKLLGTIEMKVPARFGLFARLLCWWRNRFANAR